MGEVRDELNRNLRAQRKSSSDDNPPDGLPGFPGADTVNNLLTGAAVVGGTILGGKIGRRIGQRVGRSKYWKWNEEADRAWEEKWGTGQRKNNPQGARSDAQYEQDFADDHRAADKETSDAIQKYIVGNRRAGTAIGAAVGASGSGLASRTRWRGRGSD